MKRCSKCKIEKDVVEFYKSKATKDGLQSNCKKCLKLYNEAHKEAKAIYNKQYREDHKEEIFEYKKQYQEKHKEEKALYDKQYRALNKEDIVEAKKQWYENNKEERSIHNKQYYQENKEDVLTRNRQYRWNHIEEWKSYIKRYLKERLKNDPIFKLTQNIRKRFKQWLKGNKKSKGTFKYINCTREELVEHLESRFYDNPETGEKMTWKNYGEWHVDHDRPLSSFDPTSEADMYKAWKKENLQPLWAKDNLKKGNKRSHS